MWAGFNRQGGLAAVAGQEVAGEDNQGE